MKGATPRPVKMLELKEKILRPSLTSTYIVNIQPKDNRFIKQKLAAYKVGNTSENRFDYLSLPCFEASLPGSTIATNEIIDDHTGITERHGYRRLYDDRISLSFYVDADKYYVIKFFEAWMSAVVNEQLNNFESRNYSNRVAFPTDYYADAFTVTKFEKNFGSESGEPGKSLQYDFIQAFPISIDSMPLSYDSSQTLKCTVSFSFSRYKISNAVEESDKNTPNVNAPAIPSLNNTGINQVDIYGPRETDVVRPVIVNNTSDSEGSRSILGSVFRDV